VYFSASAFIISHQEFYLPLFCNIAGNFNTGKPENNVLAKVWKYFLSNGIGERVPKSIQELEKWF
jgi:hypothetical protein